MAYIVQRNRNFYVVEYQGRDPITGSERRRWHNCGPDRNDAEALSQRIGPRSKPAASRRLTLAEFMAGPWLDTKLTLTHATRIRYRWMIDKNIAPRIGDTQLADLRAEDLDAFYRDVYANGGRRREGLSAKTVLEIHRIISNALDLAVDRRLIEDNVARRARPPRVNRRSTAASVWTANQLREFLTAARTHRLSPALHLVAYTGMRRGELAGLNWSDLNADDARLSIVRSRQAAGGRTVEAAVKTRTSRRCIDLDVETIDVLRRWRRRLEHEGAKIGPNTAMFVNTAHRPVSPESFTQLFLRITLAADLPPIRLHDLRHTHATLLVAAGTPIKVVSERLGHAHPGFTMHTYQHVLPGMGASAAHRFAALLEPESGRRLPAPNPAKPTETDNGR
jgi:integrase